MKFASLSHSLLILLGVSTGWVTAALVEFRRVPQSSVSSTRRPLLLSAISGVHPRGTSGDGPSDNSITNHLDIRYSTNITLGGKEFVVLLDTGSTDLWVVPDGRGGEVYNITHIPVLLIYGDGSLYVEGTVAAASFQMGTFSVSQQAFVRVDSYYTPGLEDLGIEGILGLGFDFPSASPINQAVTARLGASATWGSSVLTNILSQDGLIGTNFIGLDLARTDDLEDIDGGLFSIGEYAEPWTAVAQAPKLYQYPPGSHRWTTLLEGVTVGGTSLNLSSLIRGVPEGRLVALLDTGSPDAVLPRNVVNYLYSHIPGAAALAQGGHPIWLIPCNTTTIVEFTFGGQRIPVHPLDLSYFETGITPGGQSYTACIATILGDDTLASGELGFEVVLGGNFLRNVYSVFDFGDTNGTAAGQPYIQLLSQTDPTNAAAQVASTRSRTMASLPPEIEPTKLVELLEAEGIN